jgi:hypothetical protein
MLAPAEANRIAIALGKQIREVAGESTDPSGLLALSRALTALAGTLAPADVKKIAATLGNQISEALEESPDPRDVLALAEAFTALSDNLAPGEAAKIAARLGTLVSDRPGKPTAADVQREQAIDELLAGEVSVGKERFPEVIRARSRAFTVLSQHLAPAEAKKIAAMWAKRIKDTADRTTDPDRLLALSEAFVALSGKLTATDAEGLHTALTRQIIGQAARTEDADDLEALSEVFAVLGAQLPRPLGSKHAGLLAARLARIIHDEGRDYSAGYPRVMAKLSSLLSPQQLLDLLKQPGCVEADRTAILKRLGQHFQRNFRDVWELVDHVERLPSPLDCFSPLEWDPTAPQTRPRAGVGTKGTVVRR